MYERYILPKILEALTDTPVILVNGARQTGKSTLVKTLAGQRASTYYITLDDMSILAAIKRDPIGFINQLTDKTIIIDEIQRAPELFLAIKQNVDANRVPGRFLLTGSANVLLLPQLADSLAGRIEILPLWPLSMQEIAGNPCNFVDRLFTLPFQVEKPAPLLRTELLLKICQGGYPEVLSTIESRRQAWFNSYLTTIIQRDIKDLANINALAELPHLLKLLATRHTGLLNLADLSRSIGVAQTTLRRYMILLETTFLISYLPPWYNNLGKRLVKSPKLMFNDTGLVAHLMGYQSERLLNEHMLQGPLLENFVVNELRKQLGWSNVSASLYHFRTQTGQEVDIILESAAGELIGLEVKASHTVSAKDFKGLETFAELAGKRFIFGAVFYTGQEIIPFSKQLYALPVNLLWDSARYTQRT